MKSQLAEVQTGFEPLFFHIQADFQWQRPFSEGRDDRFSEKTKKNLSQNYGRWIVGFHEPSSAPWTAPCQVDKARNKNYAEDSITCRILCVIILLKLRWIPPVSYSQAFSGTCRCYKSQYMRRSSSAEFRNPRNDRGNTFLFLGCPRIPPWGRYQVICSP